MYYFNVERCFDINFLANFNLFEILMDFKFFLASLLTNT